MKYQKTRISLKVCSSIPVIDIFAGPGGLGEGFATIKKSNGEMAFKIALSIEKDPTAHKTLFLRAFFRQFQQKNAPEEYYKYIRKEILMEELLKKYPRESKKATNEAWNAELGNRSFPPRLVDKKIKGALNSSQYWVLIGGPQKMGTFMILIGEKREITT